MHSLTIYAYIAMTVLLLLQSCQYIFCSLLQNYILRPFGEAGEVGFSFLHKGIAAFLAFFGHIKKHRGITG